MVTYSALYEQPQTGDRVLIHALSPKAVPKHRSFRSIGGKRRYVRIKSKATKRKVLLVAKAARKSTKKTTVMDDDLDALEELEDLDELEDELEEEEPDEEEEEDEEEDEDEEDEDEDEDEEDEDDDEEEEEPAPKRRAKKGAKKAPAKSRSRTTDGRVGTQELAQAAGTDARTVRMYLRKHQVPKDEEVGRYEWSSVKNKEFLKLVKGLTSGGAKAVKKESLDNLKGGTRKRTTSTRAKNTGAKRTKKRRAA